MKKSIVLFLLAGLFALTAGVASAGGYEFFAKYSCWDQNGEANGIMLDVDKNSKDGLDFEYKLDISQLPSRASAAIYKTYGFDGWDGESGYYGIDSRAALQPGQTKVFDNIYLWAVPGTPVGNIALWLPSPKYAGVDPGVTYKLFLVSIPGGISYSGLTQWTMTSSQYWHEAIILPYYSTSDPSTGYKFRAEVTAVPEPSSLLALAGGLAGLGGFALKRRKV